MNQITILLFVSVTISVITYLIGRKIYIRSMNVRARLHMGNVFTYITHELLTPLTVISASVDHLREEAPHGANDYDMMQLNIQRMTRLLQQILETSKSQAGELKLLVANGDVMQYIHDTARCLTPLMVSRRINFTIDCEPKSMMGWIDPDKLDKIIYNLLSNAAKYTPNSGEVRLEVKTSKNYDYIYIKVRDTGSGIPKTKMKNLFKRYYDGEYRQHKTIGHGLGLALTRDLVYLHKGDITCESEEGHGTTFTVQLPIIKEAYSPDQIDEEQKIDLNLPKNTIIDINAITLDANNEPLDNDADDGRYRILFVEDNPELLMLMKQLFKKYYHVLVAHNGREALDIIEKTRIDLIVSDVMMPDMDGLELTQTIKEDDKFKHLPVILLTAKTQEEDQQKALEMGADDYLTKPFRLRDLKLRIDNIVENRKRLMPEAMDTTEEEEDTPPTPEEEFLRQATDCAMRHLADSEFDRDTFAAEMGASPSTLYNKLRSITGMNVSTFIRDIRMKEARRIAETEPSIRVSDLAYRVGFQDPKYFSTCFKKQYGVQPKEFLESQAATPEK